MKPNIIIVGPSGTGKSSSLRNLDPLKTAILNTERKQLPFRNADKFMNVPISSLSELTSALQKAQESEDIETIVIESFTAMIEIIFREADIRYKGFDVWSYYNKEIDRLLNSCKNTNKHIIFTAIDGVYEADNGIAERYVAVDGNRWKKRVEKEFVICLFTDNRVTEDGLEYRFRTNTLGKDSAKSPMGMFPELHIPNDVTEVLKASNEYYNI
jgi:hypothetical protein